MSKLPVMNTLKGHPFDGHLLIKAEMLVPLYLRKTLIFHVFLY